MGGSHSVKRGSEAIREDSLRVLYKTDGAGGGVFRTGWRVVCRSALTQP